MKNNTSFFLISTNEIADVKVCLNLKVSEAIVAASSDESEGGTSGKIDCTQSCKIPRVTWPKWMKKN